MSQQERRMRRHEKEQERNIEKADNAWTKAKDREEKARTLYGKDSEAYKKAKKEERAAWANFQVAEGKRKVMSKKDQKIIEGTPSERKFKRQEKEFITEKDVEPYRPQGRQSGGMIGASDMSAKKTSAPKKKKMPQYYMGGCPIKKGKPYAYGGRVAKYKE